MCCVSLATCKDNTTSSVTTPAIQHSPLGQEQLARGPAAVGGAEGSREPSAQLTEPCREEGWGSPAQQIPGRAAQGGQQQDTRDGQHGHKPEWRVPHRLRPQDNQRLLVQRLWRQCVRGMGGCSKGPQSSSRPRALLTVRWVVVLAGTGVLRGVTCTTRATRLRRRRPPEPPHTSTSRTKGWGSARSPGR